MSWFCDICDVIKDLFIDCIFCKKENKNEYKNENKNENKKENNRKNKVKVNNKSTQTYEEFDKEPGEI